MENKFSWQTTRRLTHQWWSHGKHLRQQNVTRRQNISQLCWCNSTQLPYSTVSYFRDFAILFVMTNQSQKYEEEKTAAKFAGAAPWFCNKQAKCVYSQFILLWTKDFGWSSNWIYLYLVAVIAAEGKRRSTRIQKLGSTEKAILHLVMKLNNWQLWMVMWCIYREMASSKPNTKENDKSRQMLSIQKTIRAKTRPNQTQWTAEPIFNAYQSSLPCLLYVCWYGQIQRMQIQIWMKPFQSDDK